VLSADNAIALPSPQDWKTPAPTSGTQLGLGFICVTNQLDSDRHLVVIYGSLSYWDCYLLWLVFQYFTSKESDGQGIMAPLFFTLASDSLDRLTDLAFSLDSVTTAIAVSQKLGWF